MRNDARRRSECSTIAPSDRGGWGITALCSPPIPCANKTDYNLRATRNPLAISDPDPTALRGVGAPCGFDGHAVGLPSAPPSLSMYPTRTARICE